MRSIFFATILFFSFTLTITAQGASVNVSVRPQEGVLMFENLSLTKAEIAFVCTLKNGFNSKVIETPLVTSIEQDQAIAGQTNAYRIQIAAFSGNASLLYANTGSCDYTLFAEAMDHSGNVHRTSALGIGIGTTGFMRLKTLQAHLSSGEFERAIQKDLNPLIVEIGIAGDLALKR